MTNTLDNIGLAELERLIDYYDLLIMAMEISRLGFVLKTLTRLQSERNVLVNYHIDNYERLHNQQAESDKQIDPNDLPF